MTLFLDYIRKKVGWCPQGSRQKTRTFTAPQPDFPLQVPAPAGQAAPVAVFIVPFILLLLYLCCRREVYNANN